MSTLVCIYTIFKVFCLPSVAMTLRWHILNRYRFIWTFWLTFQIYSLNHFPSCDSNTTLLPHGVLLLAFVTFHILWCKWERRGKNDAEFTGICYCQKRLILLPQDPPPQNPRDHGSCQIALHCTMYNVKPACTQNKRLCQAGVSGSLPERAALKKYKIHRHVTKHMNISGKSRFLTGNKKRDAFTCEENLHLFLSNWKKFAERYFIQISLCIYKQKHLVFSGIHKTNVITPQKFIPFLHSLQIIPYYFFSKSLRESTTYYLNMHNSTIGLDV